MKGNLVLQLYLMERNILWFFYFENYSSLRLFPVPVSILTDLTRTSGALLITLLGLSNFFPHDLLFALFR